MSYSRRAFLAGGTTIVAVASLWDMSRARAAQLLSESDPAAVALGYTADATTVDRSKYPQYAPGQQCAQCGLYQGKPGASDGPCSVFMGKLVSAKGWCASFVKRS